MEGLNNLIKWKLLSDKNISEESLISWKSASLTKVDKCDEVIDEKTEYTKRLGF